MSYRFQALIGLCVCLIGWGAASPAQSTERLIVPFACEVDGSGVRAYPSQAQRFTIIGGREAAPFTACASDQSDRCRTMMLHRFDIECDGQRIGWPEFYAAISDVTTGRARLENDRLIVRVRPGRNRRVARSRFRPPPSRRAFLVEMPDGFAPVRGTVARFQGTRSERQPARRPPLKATRDPFTSNPNLPVARVKPARPAKPTAAINKPKPQPKPKPAPKATERNVIAVPKQVARPRAPAHALPTVTKPKVATAPTAKVKTKVPPKPKAPAEKTVSNLKVVTPPPAKPAVSAPNKTLDQASAPSVVPKLLNGAKGVVAVAPKANSAPASNKTNAPAAQPHSIADLLEKRGAELRAQTAKAPSKAGPKAVSGKPLTTGTVSGTVPGTAPAAAVFYPPSTSPSLANTLAVLGVVASLLLALSYAAYRLLTPQKAPVLVAPARLTKSEIRETPSLTPREPDLARMAHVVGASLDKAPLDQKHL